VSKFKWTILRAGKDTDIFKNILDTNTYLSKEVISIKNNIKQTSFRSKKLLKEGISLYPWIPIETGKGTKFQFEERKKADIIDLFMDFSQCSH